MDFELSEEIVQDAFYKFLRQLHRRPDLTVESEGHIRAMLSNQVAWSMSEYGDRKEKEAKVKNAFPNYLEWLEPTEERIDTWPIGGVLIKNIDKLPNEIQRIILKEQILNGLSNKEIADKYNLIEGSIGTRKILGLDRIRNNHFGNNRLNSTFPERNWAVSEASLANLTRPTPSRETLEIMRLKKEGMSFKEISTKMNMVKTNVKNRYYHHKKGQSGNQDD